MGNLLAYLSLQLSLLWGIVITKLCWDKASQHLLLLRMIQLSSIQTKSEISKYKEFGQDELRYISKVFIYIYISLA